MILGGREMISCFPSPLPPGKGHNPPKTTPTPRLEDWIRLGSGLGSDWEADWDGKWTGMRLGGVLGSDWEADWDCTGNPASEDHSGAGLGSSLGPNWEAHLGWAGKHTRTNWELHQD